MTAHAFEFTAISGDRLPLSAFAVTAVLVVNTASECGYTPQYADLQKLADSYGTAGLVVLGVPSNDFGAQEPGDEAAIRAFCSDRYGIAFPMTEKVAVIGVEAHPLYRWIAETLGEDHAPRWNFHKYLIGPDGELVGAWPSAVKPLAPEITAAVEDVLG
ncbi:MAG: glutathione peroxidase [Alphaproteobacteria bacterium]|nr:glutathione peroxidase [Alphaproteobacteria bacterium]